MVGDVALQARLPFVSYSSRAIEVINAIIRYAGCVPLLLPPVIVIREEASRDTKCSTFIMEIDWTEQGLADAPFVAGFLLICISVSVFFYFFYLLL